MILTRFFGFRKSNSTPVKSRLQVCPVCQLTDRANMLEVSSVTQASPDPPGTGPLSSNAGSHKASPVGENLATSTSDPFADLFSDDDILQNASADVADLSAFLTSSPGDDPAAVPTPESKDVEDDQSEQSYFNFFLSELPKSFPYINLFPWTAATLFSSSNHYPALRQSVLAVASLIADRENHIPGEALRRLQIALQCLRNRLSEVDKNVDDGMIISSFLLAHFSMMLGDHASATKHLRGMSLFLSQLNHSRGLHKDSIPSPLTTDKLTVLIWRMAIRIDFISSISEGRAPVLAMSKLK